MNDIGTYVADCDSAAFACVKYCLTTENEIIRLVRFVMMLTTSMLLLLSTVVQMDELCRLLTNVCTVVPNGVVCFVSSFGYLEQVNSIFQQHILYTYYSLLQLSQLVLLCTHTCCCLFAALLLLHHCMRLSPTLLSVTRLQPLTRYFILLILLLNKLLLSVRTNITSL
jgi:hypothetical protein